jgi:hypothetical protein
MSKNNQVESQTRYAIFNKHNGVLFSFESDKAIADQYNENNFLIKEIVLRPGEYYFGDYYTGKIYNEDETPLIREDEMEEQFFQEIIGTYSLIKQILIIIGILEENKDLKKTESFNEFVKFLKLKKAKYDQSLKVLQEDKESFNFISIKELSDLVIKRMEGIT